MLLHLTTGALALSAAPQARNAVASVATTSTEYVVVTTTTTVDYGWDQTDTVTTTRTVKSYVTPTAEPIATSTYTNAFYDVEVVALYVPPGSVDETDLVHDYGFPAPGGGGGTSTVWVAPVTLAAPASCPTPFTVQTTATVRVPDAQTADLRPTSTRTYTGLWGPAVTLYLPSAPPGPAPTYGVDYEMYVAECQRPPSSSSSSSSPGGLAFDEEVCLRRYLCMKWGHWIVLLATVLPGLLVLGFAESFFWFRRLMRGRSALRLGTVCWVLLSAWVLCMTRKSPARPAADLPALEAQWAALSPGEKWRLWWRWGFRHKYPVDLLGPDPRHAVAAGAAEAKVEEGGASPAPPYSGPQPGQGQQTSQRQA